MTTYCCDMCKTRVENKNSLVTLTYQYDRALGSMIGTRVGSDEFCWDCFIKICWAIGNVWKGEYKPVNPVKESSKDITNINEENK